MEKKYYLFKMTNGTIYGLSFFLVGLFAVIYMLIYGDNAVTYLNENRDIVIVLYVPYLLIHELFHCYSYVIHGADFKNVTFGGHIEKGVLCCLCKQDISKKNILISLLYPFIFLGIVAAIIGLVFHIPALVILAFLNISGCSGDLLMFYHLSKIQNFEYSEYNDPIAFGLLTTEDLSKRKMIGLQYVETKTELKRDDLRKFDISKTTIIIFIFLAIASIITLVGSK